jgi:hypothetical protein
MSGERRRGPDLSPPESGYAPRMVRALAVLLCAPALACASGAPRPCRPCPPCATPPASEPAEPTPPEGVYLSSNCEAPLALTIEVTRLLTYAAAHATRSSACVDGGGRRVAIDQILVCRQGESELALEVAVAYQVGVYPEGDTRGCPAPCEWTRPQLEKHIVRLRFTRAAAGGPLRIEVPAALPGLPEMTPLGERHGGGCYRDAGPFVPADVTIE